LNPTAQQPTVTTADYLLVIGDLTVENRVLRGQIAARDAKLAELQRQLKITAAALAAKDQEQANAAEPTAEPTDQRTARP